VVCDRYAIATHHTSILQPSYFVRDYPGELVTERIWILLKQETVSGSGISRAIRKISPQTTTPILSFNRPDALPAAQPTASKCSTVGDKQRYNGWGQLLL